MRAPGISAGCQARILDRHLFVKTAWHSRPALPLNEQKSSWLGH
jgi:hypothetical protein